MIDWLLVAGVFLAVSLVALNLAYGVVICDPQRRKGTDLFAVFVVLYSTNFLCGFLIALTLWAAGVTEIEIDQAILIVAIGALVPIIVTLPLAWGYVRWRPYVGW